MGVGGLGIYLIGNRNRVTGELKLFRVEGLGNQYSFAHEQQMAWRTEDRIGLRGKQPLAVVRVEIGYVDSALFGIGIGVDIEEVAAIGKEPGKAMVARRSVARRGGRGRAAADGRDTECAGAKAAPNEDVSSAP